MMIKKIAAAAALMVLAAPSFAKIMGNVPGDAGELFLSVYDDTLKASFTLDLGVTFNDFRSKADGVEAGYSTSWSFADDANWKAFAGQADLSKSMWMVTALQKKTTGATAKDGVGLLATVRAGDESKVGAAANTNAKFTLFVGTGQFGTFFDAINSKGTHGTKDHGSSLDFLADSGNAYVGEGATGALSNNYNRNFSFNGASLVGNSAGFNYLTRSGANQGSAIHVDPFANSEFSGAFKFVAGPAGGAPVLSYDLQAVAAIPEPSTYALFAAGLLAVGFVARRRTQG